MYNLLITAGEGYWDQAFYALERGRFLEHTEDRLKDEFLALSEPVIQRLLRMPTVFAYERDAGLARVGWLTSIRVRQGEIRISFVFDEAVQPFTTEDLNAHVWEFDINRYETNRTHWAIKDVDLFEALRESGLGGDLVREPNMAIPPYAVVEPGPPEPQDVGLEVRPSVFRLPEGQLQQNLVAIMMPFDAAFDPVHFAINQACLQAGLIGRRVDNMWEDATVIQDIFSLIYRARIVIADFSTRNPNVFYETGIAHTLGRPVVPITQNSDDVPFDLRHHRFQRYTSDADGLQELTARLAGRLGDLARL